MEEDNANRGEISLPVEGRELWLVPSFANLAALEKALDCGFLELAERLSDRKLKLAEITAAFHLATRPRLSEAEAAALIEEIGLVAAYAKFGEFLTAALFPTSAEEAGQSLN